jgi:hypothetical protein
LNILVELVLFQLEILESLKMVITIPYRSLVLKEMKKKSIFSANKLVTKELNDKLSFYFEKKVKV